MASYLTEQERESLPKECPRVFFELDASGMSPLHYAASNCNLMVLEIFSLMEKCDLDFPTAKGKTCLHLAVQSSKCTPEMVIFLLSKGCDPNKLDDNQNKPIDLTTNPEIKSILENPAKALSKDRGNDSGADPKKPKLN